MSRAKLNAAIKKTGGITSVVNTDSMESLSVSQIREEAYTNRSGQNLSPAEMAAQNKRRQTLLMKMGYDLVHIDDLEPHPENDYSIDEESIENLAATIKESGNTEALLVRTVPSTSKMQILAGSVVGVRTDGFATIMAKLGAWFPYATLEACLTKMPCSSFIPTTWRSAF